MEQNRTPGGCLQPHSFYFYSDYWVASDEEETDFHQSSLNHSVNLVPSVLDCSSQETRPGCRHQLGDPGRLASPAGRCATEPLNYCRPERSAPPSSGSGLCLQARPGGGEAQKGWKQTSPGVYSARSATSQSLSSGLWLPRNQDTVVHLAP